MRSAVMSLSILLGMPILAQASDNEDYERSIARSAQACPGHSKERTVPGVRGVPVGAIRVLQQNDYILCPDRRIEGDAAVVFYPTYGVFAWNPDSPASVKAVSAVVDRLTRSEDFPAETMVWNAAGKPLSGQTVPVFEPKPNAPLHRAIR